MQVKKKKKGKQEGRGLRVPWHGEEDNDGREVCWIYSASFQGLVVSISHTLGVGFSPLEHEGGGGWGLEER